jgi:hypothetical protein
VLALISGVATFALQVLWNRAFAQVHENSMYSFSVIVAVIIFALAIGAQLARLGLRRRVGPARGANSRREAGLASSIVGTSCRFRRLQGVPRRSSSADAGK